MDALFTLYFQNTAFVVLHAIAVLGSIAVIVLWYGQLAQAKKRAEREAPRSESDIERISSGLTPFASYFDFCSSAFIFVGLLGTIIGFVSGIPQLTGTDYKFDDVLRALSTSAGGIVLSLVFNLITVGLDFLLLRPFLARLHSEVKGDSLELSIKDHLDRIDTTLLKTLQSFEAGTLLIAGAIESWRGELGALGHQQTETAKSIAQTQTSFVETHKSLVALPASIRTELAGVFAYGNKSLSDALERIKKSLEGFEKLPGKLESGLDTSFAQRRKILDEALEKYKASIESQRCSLDELYAKMTKLPLELAENLRLSSETARGLQESGHALFLEQLRGAVRKTVEDQMAELGRATGKMELSAKDLEEKWVKALSSEKLAVENAVMAALSESVRVVQQQRDNLIKMESTLPEGLAKTFQELISETSKASSAMTGAAEQQRKATELLSRTFADLTERLSAGVPREPFASVPRNQPSYPPSYPPSHPPSYPPSHPPSHPPSYQPGYQPTRGIPEAGTNGAPMASGPPPAPAPPLVSHPTDAPLRPVRSPFETSRPVEKAGESINLAPVPPSGFWGKVGRLFIGRN